MECPLLVGTLLVALAVSGCSHERLVLPPGEDPNELAAAIAAKGQETRVNEPHPPESSFEGQCVQKAIKAGQICLLAPVVVVYFCVAILANSPGFHYP